jgi:hypothetical protein
MDTNYLLGQNPIAWPNGTPNSTGRLKLEFWTKVQTPGISRQVWPLAPMRQIKRHDKGQRKIYYTARAMPQKEKNKYSVHLQPSLGHRQELWF